MKITLVTSFFLPVPPVAGGSTEKIWFRFGQIFAADGHEVTLFSRTWPGFPRRETIAGVRIERVPGFTHTRRLPWNLCLDLIWSLRVARRLPPADILACCTVLLPAHASITRPRAGKVVTVLGRMPKGQARLYGRVDRLAATSEAVRDRVLVENPRLGPRTKVFRNPIDWDLHHAARAPASPLAIGYIGRLNPEKGLEVLIDAAGLLSRRTGLPPFRVRIIGPESIPQGGGGEAYIESLRTRAAGSGAEISIEPPVYDSRELARIYGTFSVFCYPSLAEKGEGLSVAPLEAMAAGAVPVVSDLDCYRDVMRQGENSLIFNHRSPQRADLLADCLDRLLRDPEGRRRIAERAGLDAQRFDYGVVAREYLADFAALSGQPIPP